MRAIRAIVCGGVLVFAGAGVSGALTNQVDFWAATEVVMGQIGPTTMEQIKQSPELMDQYKTVLLEQALAQEAVKRGLTERLDVQRALNVARRSVLVRALRDDLIRQLPEPTENEIRSVYSKDKIRWTVPAAYQLDVFSLAASDTQAHDAAMKLATGRPVPDEDLAKLVNVQTQVLMQSGAWLTSNNMNTAIWRGLTLMKEKELRLFPDGPQTLVVRRGPFREPKLLTVQEATPFVRNELIRDRSEQAWSNYLRQVREKID